jgi:mRNA interferase RelE/StbE
LSAIAARALKKPGPSATAQIIGYLDKRLRGAADPRASGKELTGNKSGPWRCRVQDYGVICEIQDHRVIVTVITVGHRSTIYD